MLGSSLANDLLAVAEDMTDNHHLDIHIGDTMCCDDFYEGETLFYLLASF